MLVGDRCGMNDRPVSSDDLDMSLCAGNTGTLWDSMNF